jgi:hypothetical protein
LTMMQKKWVSLWCPLLVVWDYIKYARDRDSQGPGRIQAGSLQLMLWKSPNIDPVHHGLLFELILNPERNQCRTLILDFVSIVVKKWLIM